MTGKVASNVVSVALMRLFNIFFYCHMARLCWNIILVSFGFKPPLNASDMFRSWFKSFHWRRRNQVLFGAAASCWAIWLSRNDMVFKRSSPKNSWQVLFRAPYWIRVWAKLSKEEEDKPLKVRCHQTEVTAIEIFSKFGWSNRNRIEA